MLKTILKNMQNTNIMAIQALECAVSYQSALISLANEVECDKKKRRLYRAALKAEKATNAIKEILSTNGLKV